jgi:hypothetical protein
MFARTVAILTSVASGCVLACLTQAAHADAEIDLDPMEVRAGQPVSITLTCSSTTAKGIIDGPTSFGGGQVDLTDGKTTVTRIIPATTPKGEHAIKGYCEDDPDAIGYSAGEGTTMTVV